MPAGLQNHAASSPPRHSCITTLFELITALQEDGGLDDARITTALVHLCQSGRIRFCSPHLAAGRPEGPEEP